MMPEPNAMDWALAAGDVVRLAERTCEMMWDIARARRLGFQLPVSTSRSGRVGGSEVHFAIIWTEQPAETANDSTAGGHLYVYANGWDEAAQNRMLARCRSMGREEFVRFHLRHHAKMIARVFEWAAKCETSGVLGQYVDAVLSGRESVTWRASFDEAHEAARAWSASHSEESEARDA